MDFIKKLTPKSKTILFGGGMIFLASGIPWWITDYHTYSSNNSYSYASMGLCMLGALILGLFTDLKYKEKVITALVSHMIAFLSKVFQDGLEDKTNHNLFPFEMVFIIIKEGPLVLALVAMGNILRKVVKESKDNQAQH
jgi:uncharacterized protein YejL (UPF0352 family)